MQLQAAMVPQTTCSTAARVLPDGGSAADTKIRPRLTASPCAAGTKPSPRRRTALAKLHPGGLTDDWADKLVGQAFTSSNQKVTHEHYSQVCHSAGPSPLVPYTSWVKNRAVCPMLLSESNVLRQTASRFAKTSCHGGRAALQRPCVAEPWLISIVDGRWF